MSGANGNEASTAHGAIHSPDSPAVWCPRWCRATSCEPARQVSWLRSGFAGPRVREVDRRRPKDADARVFHCFGACRHAIHPIDRGLLPAVRVFIDYLAARSRRHTSRAMRLITEAGIHVTQNSVRLASTFAMMQANSERVRRYSAEQMAPSRK